MKKILVPALLLVVSVAFAQNAEKTSANSGATQLTLRKMDANIAEVKMKIVNAAPSATAVDQVAPEKAKQSPVAEKRVKPANAQIDYTKPEEKK